MRTIPLSHPLPNPEGGKIETLQLREGNEVIATDFLYQDVYGGNEARKQALLASLSGLPPAAIRKLRGSDYVRATEVSLEIIGKLILDNDELPVEPSLVLALAVPVPVGSHGRMISALNFRDHTLAEDYLGLDVEGQASRSIAMIASFTGRDISVIRKLSGADYLAAEKKTWAIVEADRSFDPQPQDDEEEKDPKKPGSGSEEQGS